MRHSDWRSATGRMKVGGCAGRKAVMVTKRQGRKKRGVGANATQVPVLTSPWSNIALAGEAENEGSERGLAVWVPVLMMQVQLRHPSECSVLLDPIWQRLRLSTLGRLWRISVSDPQYCR